MADQYDVKFIVVIAKFTDNMISVKANYLFKLKYEETKVYRRGYGYVK
jgi:hypothetical protein